MKQPEPNLRGCELARYRAKAAERAAAEATKKHLSMNTQTDPSAARAHQILDQMHATAARGRCRRGKVAMWLAPVLLFTGAVLAACRLPFLSLLCGMLGAYALGYSTGAAK